MKYPSLVVIAVVLAFALPIWAQGPAAQFTYSQARNQHPEWVQVPGELIRPDCVHEVPQGATVEIDSSSLSGGENVLLNGVLIAHYDPCPEAPVITRHRRNTGGTPDKPSINGWVEATQWNVSLGSSDNIDLMSGQWNVPTNPSENGGVVFLFNGIEPASQNWILQPVLQYGESAAGGGNYWALVSWLVGVSNTYYSSLIRVNQSDLLFGQTENTGTGSGNTLNWIVGGYDIGTSGSTTLTATTSSGLHWTWAYAGVLEAYDITSCSELPASGSATFHGYAVYHEYPEYEYIFNTQEWDGDIYSTGGLSCNPPFGVLVQAFNDATVLYF